MTTIFDAALKSRQIELEITTFLKNKSVAIVGRSPHLNNLTDGEKIDSHDVVVRIHRPMPGRKATTAWDIPPFVPTQIQTQTGKKTTIFFHDWNGIEFEFVENAYKHFKEGGGEFLCVDSHNYNPKHYAFHNLIDEKITPVRKPNQQAIRYLRHHLRKKALAGTEIVADILTYHIKSAYLVGLSTSDQTENLPDYLWLRELVATHTNITADPIMTRDFKHYPTATPNWNWSKK